MEDLNEQMIKTQLIPRGISDKRVLDAIRKVKRHLFVTKAFQDTAYFDHPLPIGEGQTISQPYMVAWMTELLNLKGTEKVLEIGTGSGYQTAVLSELAKHVFTIERIETLSINAQKILNDLNYKNISFKIGDGTEGWQNEAPFDRILITAGSPVVPAPLLKQLSEGGKLLIPLGERFAQNLTMVEKKDGKMTTKELGACVFVPLIGRHAV